MVTDGCDNWPACGHPLDPPPEVASNAPERHEPIAAPPAPDAVPDPS